MSGASADAEPARLGALEEQVMQLLWGGNACTVRELIEGLATQHAYTTVATVLTNLKRKGLVCSEKEGHATRYFACVARDEHAVRIMSHALDASGDRAASMMRFVSSMPEADIALLREYLADRDRDRDRDRGGSV